MNPHKYIWVGATLRGLSSASHNYFKVSREARKSYGAGKDEGAASFHKTKNLNRSQETGTQNMLSKIKHSPSLWVSFRTKDSEAQTEPGKTKQKNRENLRTGWGPGLPVPAGWGRNKPVGSRPYASGHFTETNLFFLEDLHWEDKLFECSIPCLAKTLWIQEAGPQSWRDKPLCTQKQSP